MTVRPSDLHAIPLFHGITDDHLADLLGACERVPLAPGEVLFEAGSEPAHLLLLTQGEVVLHEPQTPGPAGYDAGYRPQTTGEPRFRLSPIAPIGELGAVTGLKRNTTAVATQPSEVLRVGVADLRQFFERRGDVAFPFYHNLLNIVADKVRRDTRRIDEVRANLIRTQKGMKRLLVQVLESEETPLSRTICETLEELIESNRRVHYLVEPTSTLTSWVRLDAGTTVPVLEISDSRMRIAAPPVPSGSVPPGTPAAGTEWSGVLITPAGEVPVSGKVENADAAGALIKLDLFIEQYAAVLRDYLTRVQMLDFVV
jgi:CRP/FNR family cyclic AMP-dependent transcriptional regulator